MVNYVVAELDLVFGALADKTRRGLVDQLSRGEQSVSELAGPLDMSLPAVLKHLAVLERAGLVAGHKSGRVRLCSFRSEPLRNANDWLAQYERFWTSTLDSLSSVLAEETSDQQQTS